MNGVRVDVFPVEQPWVEVESNTNRQVSLVLLDLNVKVSFRHQSRAFTITAPSHTFGGKMKGLCGNKITFNKLLTGKLLSSFLGKCTKNDTNDDTTVDADWRLPNTTLGNFFK
jgi:hypothetical protein